MIVIAAPLRVATPLTIVLEEYWTTKREMPTVRGRVLNHEVEVVSIEPDSERVYSRLLEILLSSYPSALVLPSIGAVDETSAPNIVVATRARLSDGEPVLVVPAALDAVEEAKAEWTLNTQGGAGAKETVSKILYGSARANGRSDGPGYEDELTALGLSMGSALGIPVCAFRVAAALGVDERWVQLNVVTFTTSLCDALGKRCPE